MGATETTTRGLILAESVLFTVSLYSLHSRCVGYTFPKSVRLRDQRATLPQLLEMATLGWILGTTCNTVGRVGHRQTRVYVQPNVNMVLRQRRAGLLPHPTKVVDVFSFFCNRAVSLLHLHALLVSQRLSAALWSTHRPEGFLQNMQQANSGNLSLHILQKGLLGRGRRRGDDITASLQAHRCQMLCFHETRDRANRVRLSHLPIGCLRCGVLCRCACLLGICDEPGERTGGFAWDMLSRCPVRMLALRLALPVNHQRASLE